jgi:hypothetical protein
LTFPPGKVKEGKGLARSSRLKESKSKKKSDFNKAERTGIVGTRSLRDREAQNYLLLGLPAAILMPLITTYLWELASSNNDEVQQHV